MKKIIVLFLLIFIISGCSTNIQKNQNDQNIKKDKITGVGPIPITIKWENIEYTVTGQQTTLFWDNIGLAETNFPSEFTGKNTKEVYRILGIDPKKELAIKQTDNFYIRAISKDVLNTLNITPNDMQDGIQLVRKNLIFLSNADIENYENTFNKYKERNGSITKPKTFEIKNISFPGKFVSISELPPLSYEIKFKQKPYKSLVIGSHYIENNISRIKDFILTKDTENSDWLIHDIIYYP